MNRTLTLLACLLYLAPVAALAQKAPALADAPYAVDVKAFGAVGDGVADDTRALQAAIDAVTNTAWAGSARAMYARGGGTVLVPPGVYRITRSIRIGPHVRLVGQSTRGFFHPAQNAPIPQVAKLSGSVLYADFENPDQWALETANYWVKTGQPLGYAETSTGSDLDHTVVSHTHGVVIENLYLRSGPKPVYGAIRLNASPNSIIREVGAYGFRIGYEVTGSWNWSIQDAWSMTYWYGVLALRSVNAFTITGYFNRLGAEAPTAATPQPNGIYTEYRKADLTDYRYAATGIYLNYATSFDVKATSEGWDVGAQFINAQGVVPWLHVERPGLVAVATIASQVQILSLYNLASNPVASADVGSNANLSLGAMGGNPRAPFQAVSKFGKVNGPTQLGAKAQATPPRAATEQ